MRIAVSADEDTGVAGLVAAALVARGHDVVLRGALAAGDRPDWAWASEAAARDVAEGRADQAVVCCWTGTGASIAANKVASVRAALCADAANVGHVAEIEAPRRRRYPRMMPSTSSRRRSMSSRDTRDSRHRRSSGSVFDGRTLKCQSS